MMLVNNGSFAITLKNLSGSSSSGNQFSFGADLALAANSAVSLVYDGVASKWRSLGASSAGSGTVTSVSCNGGETVITISGTCSSRTVLVSARTYYVATTGSDSNTGQATATTATVTFTNGSANIGWTSHGRSVGDVVIFTTTGAVPTNFTVFYMGII